MLCVTPYYAPAYVYGGPARSLPNLCRALAQAGVEITVFTTDANGEGALDVPLGRAVTVDGVPVFYFHRDWPGSFFYSGGLASACRERIGGLDLVYVASIWTYPLWPVASSCRRERVPFVLTPRNTFPKVYFGHKATKKFVYMELFQRRLINHARAIHYTTEEEAAGSAYLRLKPPSFVVPNAVEFPEAEHLPASGLMRARLGIPQDALVFLYMGRLHSKKGIDLAIRALAQVEDGATPLYFVIAGPDVDCQPALEQLVRDLSLEGRVLFPGFLGGEERLAALSDTDLFVLTSQSENFGMAAAEAMLAGVPALLSETVPLSKEVGAAGCGFVASLEVASIADAMRRAVTGRAHLKEMGQRARGLMSERYGDQGVARSMVAAFERVMAATH